MVFDTLYTFIDSCLSAIRPIRHIHCQNSLPTSIQYPFLTFNFLVILISLRNSQLDTFYHTIFYLQKPFIDISLRRVRINYSIIRHMFFLTGIHSMNLFLVIKLESLNAFKTFFQMWLDFQRVFGFG